MAANQTTQPAPIDVFDEAMAKINLTAAALDNRGIVDDRLIGHAVELLRTAFLELMNVRPNLPGAA